VVGVWAVGRSGLGGEDVGEGHRLQVAGLDQRDDVVVHLRYRGEVGVPDDDFGEHPGEVADGAMISIPGRVLDRADVPTLPRTSTRPGPSVRRRERQRYRRVLPGVASGVG